MLIILACFAISNYTVQSDIDCLRSIKESLEDPDNIFSSWDFSNSTEGFVCRFTGVECWHLDESMVLNIRLADMGLRGPFPIGIRNCTNVIPFVAILDLSNNNLSGPIPPSIGNLSFINVPRLDNNQLTGQIPLELSQLRRIKEFSVANNRLSGQVPMIWDGSVSTESYAHNLGLCGDPLPPCKINKNHDDHFFSGFAVGFPVSTTLTMLLMFFCLPRLSMSNMGSSFLLIINKIKGMKYHLIPRSFQSLFTEENSTKITIMEKYVRRMSLMELKLVINDFDIKNVISYGNMGLMYKAVFPNGLMLAIKRLHKFESFEREFLPQVEGVKMRWSLRLRIALGIARGLAWLHHNNVLLVAHLKISSSCILLDDKFEPKISNFGNSNILMYTSGTLSTGDTFVVPHSSHVRYKEDVYSFGILLLELVSGRERPYAQTDSLRDNVCAEEINMIDECLMGQGFDEEIYETLRIAENCIQTHKHGATSMLEVYQSIRVIVCNR
ncbi:hypothetical protein L1987_23645 [Smallanthus sonchifolius]|uniref:Uncharacterized protein n=1 Tax=Smallanthus sonchifolius TaxID=185202 RepID=A0ACB9IIU4_9ASTR|nr:hypothetical protein L1987_23645 [Smallanthus sonchifolius]